MLIKIIRYFFAVIGIIVGAMILLLNVSLFSIPYIGVRIGVVKDNYMIEMIDNSPLITAIIAYGNLVVITILGITIYHSYKCNRQNKMT